MKDFKGNNFSEQIYSWSATNETASYVYNGATNTYDPIPDYWEWTPPAIPDQDQTYGCATCGPGYEMWNLTHYYGSVQYHYDVGSDMSEDMAEQAQTHQRLYTGGRAGINRNNLFCLYASATAYGAPPQADTAYPWWLTPGITVPGRSLQVGGKPVGADGKLWLALPDNSDIDLTVAAPGKKHYDATAIPVKYKLVIQANNLCLASGHVRPEAYFCVGQKLTFQAVFVPDISGDLSSSSPIWNYTAAYINHHWTDANNCEEYNIALIPQTSNPTTAWFYNQQTQDATAYYGVNCKFNNGQSAYVTSQGKFNVYRPQVDHWTLYNFGNPTLAIRDSRLEAGDYYNNMNGMSFKAYVVSANFPGQAGFTQVISGESDGISDVSMVNQLDGTEFIRRLQSIESSIASAVNFDDQPNVPLPFVPPEANTAMMRLNFVDYLRFRPFVGNPSDNIFVTLQQTTWGVNASAIYNYGLAWQIVAGSSITGPTSPTDSNIFPIWDGIFTP